MSVAITRLTDIESRLYCSIVIDGLSPTAAVAKVAESEHMSEINIWKNYYPNIRDELRKVR